MQQSSVAQSSFGGMESGVGSGRGDFRPTIYLGARPGEGKYDFHRHRLAEWAKMPATSSDTSGEAFGGANG